MALSQQQRIALGLDDEPVTGAPGTPSNEFTAGGPAYDSRSNIIPLAAPPNPLLQLTPGDPATAPKIRRMVNELIAGNMQQADLALKQLFVANPKVGLDIYTELMQFAMPKLKAVAVAIDDRSENPKNMNFADLVKAMQDGD